MSQKKLNLFSLVNILEQNIKNPQKGLPDDIFYFIGRMTPFINVDLIIKCPINGVVLTWRDDRYSGRGWHFPGGIIRFREKISNRIVQVGKLELGIKISKFFGPLEVNEIIINQRERSHFISLLYSCRLEKKEMKKLLLKCKKNKEIRFFKSKPKNLLKWHLIYKDYL